MTLEELANKKASILKDLNEGKTEDAKIEIKEFLDNFGIPELDPLFNTVITNAWKDNQKPNIVLNKDDIINISSEKADGYLQKMIYLFTDLYPYMLTKEVKNKNGIEIIQSGFRQDILIAIAKGLYKKVKDNCSEKELGMANDILNNIKILITDKSQSIEVISALNTTYPELGLLKEIDNSRPPKK